MNADDPLLIARLGLAVLDRLAADSLDLLDPRDTSDAAAWGEAGQGPGQTPDRRRGRVVLVTSVRTGEGKSFVAGLLHASLAMHQQFAGNVSLTDGALLHGRLAEGTPLAPASAALLFQPAAVRQALAALRQRHALTVLDGATLADCGALAREVDAVVLVVDARSTPRRGIERALAAARIPPARLAGVVLNRREPALPRWLGAE